MSATSPQSENFFPLFDGAARDVALHSGANGQLASNDTVWPVLRFAQDGSAWASGTPALANFACTVGTTYFMSNDCPGTLSLSARAASSSTIELLSGERSIVVAEVDPATNSVEFRKMSSNVDALTNSVGRARGVVTVALAAYTRVAGVITANANGAIGAVMDGLTPVLGDTVLLPEGIAAAASDAGPYVVTSAGAGGSPFVLNRPAWWKDGSTLVPGAVVTVGPAGTVYGGSEWKCFVTAVAVVGTDAPLLTPRNFRKTITLTNGTVTVGAADFLALRSTTRSTVQVTRNTPGAATANTIQYQCAVAGRTAGAIGTAALTVIAAIAAGTINAADTLTTLDLLVTNW